LWIGLAAVMLLQLSLCGLFLRGCANAHNRPRGHDDITFDISESGDALVFNATGTGGRDLYVLRLSDLSVTRIAETLEYEVSPSFSPDATSVVYAAGVAGDRADHIFIRRLDGTDIRQLTSADANDSSPHVSPDGSLVVFDRDKTYNWGGLAANWDRGGVICVVGVDGRNERQITADDTFGYEPWFLPDGKSVAYLTPSGVFSVPIDGSAHPGRLIDLTGANAVASSRDGKIFAYTRGQFSGDQEIFIANSGGSGERRITPTNAGYYHPVFSGDGNRLYFFQEEWPDGPTGTPRFSIWQIDVDGTNLRIVATRQLFDQPLNWKPEARHN
jgi:TolB protein